jgi:hypothetical protein
MYLDFRFLCSKRFRQFEYIRHEYLRHPSGSNTQLRQNCIFFLRSLL